MDFSATEDTGSPDGLMFEAAISYWKSAVSACTSEHRVIAKEVEGEFCLLYRAGDVSLGNNLAAEHRELMNAIREPIRSASQ
ncbi:hypothetical protein [Novipirellula galeiformis]|nr:hypothetical protein [Novipirellula galeiformis]